MTESQTALYGGIQFRSRLEARWAIFFDSLGLEWQYEPRRFLWRRVPNLQCQPMPDDPDYNARLHREYTADLQSQGGILGYVPDFYLPAIGWIEIKGSEEDANDPRTDLKARMLRFEAQEPVYLIWGSLPMIWASASGHCEYYPSAEYSAYAYSADGFRDHRHWWCHCKTCGAIGLAFDSRKYCMSNHYVSCDETGFGLTLQLAVALERGRHARFVGNLTRAESLMSEDETALILQYRRFITRTRWL